MASEATCDHDGFNDDDNDNDDLVPNNDNVIAGKKDQFCDGDDLFTIGEQLRPSPSMRTTSFPCWTRSATSRANLWMVCHGDYHDVDDYSWN